MFNFEDFSIDSAQERITDQRTRGYFSEVFSSYANGNYRSAVVMLWSVVVCDLLFKLDLLNAMYADPTANKILTEIDELRKKNPKSPDWEWALVDKVKNQTHLLEMADMVNLQALRDHRHLCAHPVLSGTEALYSPSKEQCRSHIRNALDGVLTKPAIMSRRVFDTLVEDIEAQQALLPDDESLRRYLDARYWRNLKLVVEQSIFKSLWRLVFRTNDPRCNANRSINYRVLCLLYNRHSNELDLAIHNDADYYSQITLSGDTLDYVMRFLAQHPKIIKLLTDAATTPIRSYVNQSIDAFLNAWFLSENVESHLGSICERIRSEEAVPSHEAFQRMYAVAKADGHHLTACEIGIELYGTSRSYADADFRCEHFVLPYLSDYDSLRMKTLLDAIESNSQTHDRRRAKYDHQRVGDTANQLLPRGWVAEYGNFMQWFV